MFERVFVVSVLLSGCLAPPTGGGGAGGGGAGGGGAGGGSAGREAPERVKLKGTIELSQRTYNLPGGSVVFERTSKGSFEGTSSSSDHTLSRLRYVFDQPFMVSGTHTSFDTTLNPRECTVNVSGSGGSNLELVVGRSGSAWLAQLTGSVFTSATGTCGNGAAVQTGFAIALPNGACPDPAIKELSGGKWLAVSGDPFVGFDLSQDVTCASTTVKIAASIEAL